MNDPSYLRYDQDMRRERISSLLGLYAKIAGWGIFAIIVFAILFPLNACGCGPYRNARKASCQSNMKQLGLALAQYTQDSDDELPPITQPASKATWREALYPFVKSTGVYRCPDDESDYRQATPDKLPHSYGANSIDWNKHPIASPFITLVDMDGYDGPEWTITSPAFLPNTGRELHMHKPNHAFYQHPSGSVNCLFTDGHVKAMKPIATLTPNNLWTRDNKPFTGQDLTNAQAILQHAQDE